MPIDLTATPTAAPWVRRGAQLALALALAWLVACIYFVNIDFDDGYTTIVNSKYLLGTAPVYYWQRGPIVAMLLLPGEFMARFLGLEPFDVRSHHVVMAIVHFAYLVGTWKLLRVCHGEKPSTLLAFLAAIFTVAFFSYAPFISHDIFPGLLVVVMIKVSVTYWDRPGWRAWLALVILGAGLALIKQTYALVWVMLLLAHLLMYLSVDRARAGLHKLCMLGAAAAVSGLVTWITYGYFLGSVLESTPLLLRPIVQISMIANMYAPEGDAHEVFYQWLYLRNLSAYGLLAMVLVIPALIFSLRQPSPMVRIAAVVWLLYVLTMQVIPFKEVRYLVVLAPLTAFLIAPVIEWAWQRHALPRFAMLAVLALQLVGAGTEALRVTAPYYRTVATDFLRPLPTGNEIGGKFAFAMSLSFVSPEAYAFFADRYHRITHISGDHIRYFLGYGDSQVERLNTFEGFDATALPVGSVLLFVNDFAYRRSPFRADNLIRLNDFFIRLLGVAESLTLTRDGDVYRFAAGRAPVFFLPAASVKASPVIADGQIPVDTLQTLTGRADVADELVLTGFRIRSFCVTQSCKTYAE